MTTTVTALYDSQDDAVAAVRALQMAGIARDAISIIAKSADDPPQAAETRDHEDHVAEVMQDAGAGAGIGAGIGGAGGLLAGLGIIAIPGIGPVLAGGWLLSTAAGALAGAAVGGAAGGIIGALMDGGLPEDDAHACAESVRRGGALVVAKVDAARLDAARTILRAPPAIDPAARASDYRKDGWSRFNPEEPPHGGESAPRRERPDRLA
ncbi:hypothetical protein [Roseixanthobacter glucoisosaccharinicivorans]|uniref:hypothetical protein n=1 Tax=Roseixanthobacter glucoisosaccharinicivorans TaxID=3119923 RepID=UPI003727321F